MCPGAYADADAKTIKIQMAPVRLVKMHVYECVFGWACDSDFFQSNFVSIWNAARWQTRHKFIYFEFRNWLFLFHFARTNVSKLKRSSTRSRFKPLIFSALNHSASHRCGFGPSLGHMWDKPIFASRWSGSCFRGSPVFAPSTDSAYNGWNNLDES